MTIFKKIPARFFVIFCCVSLLSNCTTPQKKEADTAPSTAEAQAQALLAAGEYVQAADEYTRLAESSKNNANEFLLKAAGAYLEGEETALADSALLKLREDKLSAIQILERNILQARIAILNKDAQAAIKKLGTGIPEESPRPLLAAYYQTRAMALQMDRQPGPALRARIELAQYLDAVEVRRDNQREIWQLISQMQTPEIEQELANAVGQPTLASWLELGVIYKTLVFDPPALENAITAWTQRYPDHPAIDVILGEIRALSGQVNVQPRQVALLLPFSAQYQDASRAIREGFLAAWYEASGDKPLIKIYNADNQNIVSAYQTAVNEGADVIVGPLEKEAMATLLASGNITVKTLALNQINGSSENDQDGDANTAAIPLFQFGLLPEDETILVADRAWSDGRANALIITLDNSWGDRIFNAFSEHWTRLGGRVVEHVKIPANTEDYAKPVKQILNIANSEQRTKELTAALRRTIHFEPRHRQDADIIFLAATPVMARQLIPQLRYFRADDISSYSISTIYTGQHDPEANSDINGVIFPDMPWMIDPAQEYSPLQQTLNNTWRQDQSPYRRLYAFGIDAYRVIPELGKLSSHVIVFQGVTGDLRMNANGQIQRQPAWARFVDGTPGLLGAGLSP